MITVVRLGQHLFLSNASPAGPVLERVTNGSVDATRQHSPGPSLLVNVHGALWGALGGGEKRAEDEPTGIDVIDQQTLRVTSHVKTRESIVAVQTLGPSVFAASRSTVYEIEAGRVRAEHSVDGLTQVLTNPAAGLVYVVAMHGSERTWVTSVTAFTAGRWRAVAHYRAPGYAYAAVGAGRVWLQVSTGRSRQLVGLNAANLRAEATRSLPMSLGFSTIAAVAGRLWFLQTGTQTLACADVTTGRLLHTQQPVGWDRVVPVAGGDAIALSRAGIVEFRAAGDCS